MAWRRARSLIVLEEEIQEVAPGTTVWDIGDEAHQQRDSDHNPNQDDVVCAIDVLNNAGLDLQWFVDTITTTDPPALKYVIYRNRIWFPQTGWQPYSGKWHSHGHVSAGWGPDGQSTGPYDDISPWGLAEGNDMIGLSKGDEGQKVKGLQVMVWKAGFDPGPRDGVYGPRTSAAVLAMRKSVGSGATSGDHFGPWAFGQLHEAIARRYARRAAQRAADDVRAALEAALADLPAGGLPSRIVIDLPDEITVPVEADSEEDE